MWEMLCVCAGRLGNHYTKSLYREQDIKMNFLKLMIWTDFPKVQGQKKGVNSELTIQNEMINHL